MRTKIRNQILCTLLTLALCIGLVPGTALAGTSHTKTGNLNILAKITANPSVPSENTSPSDLDTHGYKWEWDSSKKELEITLKDCSIKADSGKSENGDLILPAGSTITINLKGTNSIAGEINVESDSTYKGMFHMTIQGSGSLNITGRIGAPCQDGDTVTIAGGATVTADRIDIGGSAGNQSILKVIEGSSLTLKCDKYAGGITKILIEDKQNSEGNSVKGSKLIIEGRGLKITGADTGDSPNIEINGERSSIEIKVDSGAYALQTEPSNKSGLSDILSALGSSSCLPPDLYDYENGSAKYLLQGNSSLNICYKGNTALEKLIIAKYHEIRMEMGGSSNVSRQYYQGEVTLDPDSGRTVDYWNVTPFEGDGGGFTVSGTVNRFTMPPCGVYVTPVYKTGDSDGDGDGDGGGSHRTHWYDIEVIQPEHGFLEAPEKGYKNLGIDMVLTLEDGYVLDEILVTNKDGTETFKVRKDKEKDNTYQFTMPAKDVIVTPILKQAEQKNETPYILLTLDQKLAWVFNHAETMDVPPVLRDDRVMLPARFIIEALGGTVAWDADAQKVTIQKGGKTIALTIGADFAEVDGEEVALDAPAFIENGRTYLPIRFIAENLGASVSWDSATLQVMITPEK